MKIGIEAKWLFDGPPGGRRVVQNLVRCLADWPSGGRADELHFFLDARARGQPLPTAIRPERAHYVWGDNNQLSNVFVVPRVADALGLDGVVYQNFAPPRRTARHARVAFIHDVIFESHPRSFTWRERLYFKPLRYLASRADRVCTLSDTERRRLVRYRYAHADHVDVVPNAVDDAFVPRERLDPGMVDRVLGSLNVPKRFVLYAGRLNARKNVGMLVRAMAHVADPALHLLIAGAADSTETSLREAIDSAGVANRVRLLGSVSDEELRVLYATATVFCFPSLDEGFGLPPLEAMAAGAPTIISNIPVLVETCGDGAMAVDATDPAAIGDAITVLAADDSRRSALRDAGRRRARSFSWRRSSEQLLASVHAAVSAQ
jgi:glycosyltransferase involved in cell wall biosynthesis